MNQKKLMVIVLLSILTAMLAACVTSPSSGSVEAVENYINALVDKDEARLSSLSCADWEAGALLELDSFLAVDVRLEGMTCSQQGVDGEVSLVVCQGKLIKSYENEDQELDLSLRTYEVVHQAGEYLVCGYR